MSYCLPNSSCAFCVKILLSSGAAVDVVNNFGCTALMMASGFGSYQVAEVRSRV